MLYSHTAVLLVLAVSLQVSADLDDCNIVDFIIVEK